MSDGYRDEVIDNLSFHYYCGILKLQNEEDILRELPEAKYDNFFLLIDGLIKLFIW